MSEQREAEKILDVIASMGRPRTRTRVTNDRGEVGYLRDLTLADLHEMRGPVKYNGSPVVTMETEMVR